jgi:hypothetical protein
LAISRLQEGKEAKPTPNFRDRKSLDLKGSPREVENVEVEDVETVETVESMDAMSKGYR